MVAVGIKPATYQLPALNYVDLRSVPHTMLFDGFRRLFVATGKCVLLLYGKIVA